MHLIFLSLFDALSIWHLCLVLSDEVLSVTVFEVPAKLNSQIIAQNLHQIYVSCEAGYPEVGDFTIYINIPGIHRSMLNPWYKLVWNKAGFFLYLKHGDQNNRKTETLVPFNETVKVPSVPLAEWRKKISRCYSESRKISRLKI